MVCNAYAWYFSRFNAKSSFFKYLNVSYFLFILAENGFLENLNICYKLNTRSSFSSAFVCKPFGDLPYPTETNKNDIIQRPDLIQGIRPIITGLGKGVSPRAFVIGRWCPVSRDAFCRKLHFLFQCEEFDCLLLIKQRPFLSETKRR